MKSSGTGNIVNDLVSIVPGATVTFTVVAQISCSATGNLTNTATVGTTATTPAGVTDSNTGNNSASDTDTPTPAFDLAITKTDGTSTYTPGSSTTYTIVVSNNGPSAVTGAAVNDTMPSLITSDTWTAVASSGASVTTASGTGNIVNDLVSIVPGATVTFTVVAQISCSATSNLTNRATVGTTATTPAGVTDSNTGNNSATDTDTMTKATTSIATTPTPTVFTIGATSGKLTDSATLSGGASPTGSITFKLYGPNGGNPLDVETVTGITGDGTYSTPTGYTVPANATPGVYQWDAYYNGDGSNQSSKDENNAWEQVQVVNQCCNLTNVSFSINGKTTTYSDLAGITNQGDSVTANFTVPNGNYDQLTIVTYTAPEGFYNANDANLQVVYQVATGFFGPGAHTLGPVTIPSSFYQIDFVCGAVITTLGPAGTNNFYHNQNRFISGDNGGLNPVGSSELQVVGTVFADTDNDGTQDSGESGLSGVSVTLAGTDAYGNSVSYTTTTNSKGAYTFAGMPFSDANGYTITPTAPSGYIGGIATAGKVNNSADGTALSIPEAVGSILMQKSSQTNGTGYNFGMVKPVSLSGKVFTDTDGDGNLDNGESGLSGVTISLKDANGNKITSTTTNSSGNYSFGNLSPGTYQLVETILSNYLGTGNDVGTVNGNTDGAYVDNMTIGSIALNSGQSGSGYNFGEAKPVCISGKVFNDSNGNGNCDNGESGLSNVTVTLYDCNGNTVATTTTNSSGAYSFGNIGPGTYSVVDSVPSGYNATGTDIGSAGGSSPNKTTLNGIYLTSGQTASGYNFGLKKKS